MWMVTGTTRNIGLASIITTSRTPGQMGQISVWPGKGKACAVLQRLFVVWVRCKSH